MPSTPHPAEASARHSAPLTPETRGPAHCDQVRTELHAAGLTVLG